MEQRHAFPVRNLPADVATMVVRAAGTVYDVGSTTGWHLRRLAAIVASAVTRAESEVRDLVWDVRVTAVTRQDAVHDDIALPPGVSHVRLHVARPRR